LIFDIENDGDLWVSAVKATVGGDHICSSGASSTYIGGCTSLRDLKTNITEIPFNWENYLKYP